MVELEGHVNDAYAWWVIAVLLACLAGCMLLYGEREEGLPDSGASLNGRPVQAWLYDLGSEDRATVHEAIEALGTMGPANAGAVPELAKALQVLDPLVRAGAARALGRIGPAARPASPALESATEVGLGLDVRKALQARSRIEGVAKHEEPLPAGGDTR
jgi:hypothetical protein